jgi:CspA family cold shock protein
MIRIIDFAARLERLHILEAHDDQLDDVFDQVCKQVFGATSDEIPDEEIENFPDLQEAEAIRYAAEQGFDITDEDGIPLRDWESFVIMIQAREEGFLPGGPNDTPERRLKREAERFKRQREEIDSVSRRSGKVMWFNAEKGFGFIKPDTSGVDVFVHISDLTRAGLEVVRAGDRLVFEVQEESRGREKAVNLRLAKSPQSTEAA